MLLVMRHRMNKVVLASALAGAAADTIFAQDITALEARHHASISTPEGKEYEKKGLRAFWGDVSYMPACVAEAGSDAEPIRIFYEVNASGELTELVIVPKSVLGECIRRHVEKHTFPKPPHAWVGDIRFSIRQ